MAVYPELIRNSIPKQNKSRNEKLSLAQWNNYINVLREQTNSNTRFLEKMDKDTIHFSDVVVPVGDNATNALIALVTTNVLYTINQTEAFLFTDGLPPEDYMGVEYGKVIEVFEVE